MRQRLWLWMQQQLRLRNQSFWRRFLPKRILWIIILMCCCGNNGYGNNFAVDAEMVITAGSSSFCFFCGGCGNNGWLRLWMQQQLWMLILFLYWGIPGKKQRIISSAFACLFFSAFRSFFSLQFFLFIFQTFMSSS